MGPLGSSTSLGQVRWIWSGLACAPRVSWRLGWNLNGLGWYINSLWLLCQITQSGWLKTIKVYSFMVLAARSLKSMCWQCCAPLKGSIGKSILCLIQLLVAAGIPWLAATLLLFLPLSSHHLLLFFVSSFLGISKLFLPLHYEVMHDSFHGPPR